MRVIAPSGFDINCAAGASVASTDDQGIELECQFEEDATECVKAARDFFMDVGSDFNLETDPERKAHGERYLNLAYRLKELAEELERETA